MGVMNEDRLTLYDGLIKTHITNTTVAKETGKGLSTNDYTTTEKNKLAGVAEGANKTIVDSALDASSENPVQNKVIAGEITTLKKSVSDGKTLVATAITDKGVDTAADATFAVMAENIGQIETGGGELHGATISVSTSEENPTAITVTLTKDSTTIGQKNFDSNGLCTFTDIQESGDYTVTASDGTDSNSTTVTVTGDNIVNKTVVSVTIDFTLDGSTATPLNDVSIWLRTDSTGSSLNAGHTTLAEVIADTTTLNNLMADQSAMQYLARSTGFADDGCASETFMTYLGASPHVDSTVLNSDLWMSAIKQSPYKNKVLPQADLVVGNTYKFDGYNWIVAEKSDVSGYAVLQSTGLTGGTWPGYAMSGTLTNAAGSTITLTKKNTYYTGNIDGYDISNYNSTTQSLYNSIKAAEYTSATYGKGLYLVSNSKSGTTSNGSQGSGYYWSALKSAAANPSSFGVSGSDAWLGTVYGSDDAWCVYQNGGVYCSGNQDSLFVVAPAFNLDACLVNVSGDEIVLL